MTASIANGFAHVLYTPGDHPCQSAPYAFHAEHGTANPRGNIWSAHTTDVSFSDEIGHFEHCLQLDANFNCAIAGSDDPGGLDADDVLGPGQGRLSVLLDAERRRRLPLAGGGDFIPGTVNDYGGSSAEFGSLLLTTYPGAGFTPIQRYENFNSGDLANSCPASG